MDIKDLVKKIRHLEFSTNQKVNELFVGNYKSAFKGRGIEFADIREYDESDDFRDIDWVTTAKQQKLFVKTYHESRELGTLLLIDVSGSMHVASTPRTKKEIALELIAMLCFSALKNNDRMGAVFFTDTVKEFIAPKKGLAQVWKILRSALLHYDQNMYSRSSLDEALNFARRVFPRKAILFIVSDEFDPENTNIQKALKSTHRQHDCVFTRIWDPLEKMIHVHGIFRIQDPETGRVASIDLTSKKNKAIFREKRETKEKEMKRILGRSGIDMVEFGPEDSLYKKLFLFFKQRQLK